MAAAAGAGRADAAVSRNGRGCWHGRVSHGGGWAGPAAAVPIFGHEEAARLSAGEEAAGA